MATFFWFWLFVNLGNDLELSSRLLRRSIASEEKCQESKDSNSFLWIMKRSPPVYFFGTIHVPYTKVWDYIPSHSKQAFYMTDNIYLELDLTDPKTSRTLAQCQLLPDGVRLRDVVPVTMYRRIKKHLSYYRKMLSVWMTADQRMMGLTPLRLYKALTGKWFKKRPIWILLLLKALTEYDTKSRGIPVLDTYLIREAVLRGKRIRSIESVQEQCEPLNALNNSQVITALDQTLKLYEKLRHGKAQLTHSTKELIDHYNCGNLSKVLFAENRPSFANVQNSSDDQPLDEMYELDNYLKKELIYKRNKKMAKRVMRKIQEQPQKSFFFAFGAGHFLGEGSIIDILRTKGFQITHLPYNATLPSSTRHGRHKNRIETMKKKKERRQRRRRKFKGKQRNRKSRRRWYDLQNAVTKKNTVRNTFTTKTKRVNENSSPSKVRLTSRNSSLKIRTRTFLQTLVVAILANILAKC